MRIQHLDSVRHFLDFNPETGKFRRSFHLFSVPKGPIDGFFSKVNGKNLLCFIQKGVFHIYYGDQLIQLDLSDAVERQVAGTTALFRIKRGPRVLFSLTYRDRPVSTKWYAKYTLTYNVEQTDYDLPYWIWWMWNSPERRQNIFSRWGGGHRAVGS